MDMSTPVRVVENAMIHTTKPTHASAGQTGDAAMKQFMDIIIVPGTAVPILATTTGDVDAV